MENQKKQKTLVRCSTTVKKTVCTHESSAPVAKRLKAQSVVDKDSSSDSDAPKAKRRPRRRFLTQNDVTRPAIIRHMRSSRRETALDFCSGFDLSSVLRYHILGHGRLKKQQVTSAFGIPWVAVSGRPSISVVARSEDVLRLHRDLGKNDPCFLRSFWHTLISEVEDLPGKLSQMLELDYLSCKRPFGVVSVIKQDSNKASRDEYNVKRAIEFLQEKMQRGEVLTTYQTKKTAISAFQQLFGKEFEDDEIRVFVFQYIGDSGKELKQRRKVFDISEFLAIMNKARD